MKKALLILNPRAGQRRANRFLADIIRLFCENDYRTEVYVTGQSGDATRYLAAQPADAFDLVICAGGDGTLNETIAGLLHAGLRCPIGYIPCGSTNDYAASIGLSGDVMQAARDIMEGQPHCLDIGTFNGRYFVYTATCGAFARTSYTTSQAAKNVLGHLAYVFEGVKDLASIRPIHLKVETENQSIEDDFLICSVTNSTSVGGILRLDSQLVALDDGRFEVTLVRNPVTPQQLSTVLYGLTTQDVPNEMIYFFSAQHITFTGTAPVEWTVDGERADETDRVTLENLNGKVAIIIPNVRQVPVITAPPLDEAEE